MTASGNHQQKNIIDWEHCLKLANNKESLAKQLLELLSDQLRKEQQQIQEAQKENDIIRLRELNHAILGSISYCGVPELEQASHQLQTCLKQTHNDNDISQPLQKLLDAINNFLNVYNKIN